MKAFKQVIVLLILTVALSEAKRHHHHQKCTNLCPPCNMDGDKSMWSFAERILNAKGPADGACANGDVKYIWKGDVYGFPYDACCCLPIPPPKYPVQCKPRDPEVPECGNNFGLFPNETINEYFIRVGQLLPDAPPNGCCREGTYKYIVPAELSKTEEDKCVCLLNSNAQTPLVDKCPPCNMDIDKSMYDFGERMLKGKGPQDGYCDNGDVKYVWKGDVYGGYPYNACCCLPIPPPKYPVQCSPRDPNALDCGSNFGIFFNETIREWFGRVGELLPDAPPNGCCPEGTYKYISPAEYTKTEEDKCVCLLNSNAQTPLE